MGGHGSYLFPGTLGSSGNGADNHSNDGKISDESGNLSPSSAGSARERLLNEATTDEARRIVDELYRSNAGVGDGGTADAIREQLQTSKLVGGKDHVQKGRERLRQIEKILFSNPDHPDRALLERLRDDLKDALGGAWDERKADERGAVGGIS